ncbi:MAG: hypothetical protein P8J37_06290 [Fuerstiella sp.]|nr:hypothetical protein [Fuerstiella sp.]
MTTGSGHSGSASLPGPSTRGRFWELAMQWAISVDHKKLAMMYIGAGLIFFLVGGIEAAFMRLQLAQAGNEVVDLGPAGQPRRSAGHSRQYH